MYESLSCKDLYTCTVGLFITAQNWKQTKHLFRTGKTAVPPWANSVGEEEAAPGDGWESSRSDTGLNSHECWTHVAWRKTGQIEGRHGWECPWSCTLWTRATWPESRDWLLARTGLAAAWVYRIFAKCQLRHLTQIRIKTFFLCQVELIIYIYS